ncbi:MAG: hypothetical protein FWD15_01150 [Alphaproteobacteria bacterium]|nr:hypothetical protein [Alphaproteobacteria bacterium]
MKKSTVYGVCIASSMMLVITSAILQYRANLLNKEIAGVERDIAGAETEIRVVRAEIISLLSITRVRQLSDARLSDFKAITARDIISVFDIPINPKFEAGNE